MCRYLRSIHYTHLQDTTTYKHLSQAEAISQSKNLMATISTWLKNHQTHIDKAESKYIKLHMQNNQQNPFGQFYIAYKIHKGIKNNNGPPRPSALLSAVYNMALGNGSIPCSNQSLPHKYPTLRTPSPSKMISPSSTSHQGLSSSLVMQRPCTQTSQPNQLLPSSRHIYVPTRAKHSTITMLKPLSQPSK